MEKKHCKLDTPNALLAFSMWLVLTLLRWDSEEEATAAKHLMAIHVERCQRGEKGKSPIVTCAETLEFNAADVLRS
jgi:hypothetical protein